MNSKLFWGLLVAVAATAGLYFATRTPAPERAAQGESPVLQGQTVAERRTLEPYETPREEPGPPPKVTPAPTPEPLVPPVKTPDTVKAPEKERPYCPVAKPNPVPSKLQRTFSDNPDVLMKVRKEELADLAAKFDADQDVATALRWFVHQPERNDELKRDALKVLTQWNMEWCPVDLEAMIKEPLQPLAWRKQCVAALADFAHYRVEDSIRQLVQDVRQDKDPAIRDCALEVMGAMCEDEGWARVHPERYAFLAKEISASLKDPRPEARLAALRAAGGGHVFETAKDVETLAASDQEKPEMRNAALAALASIARSQSLAVIDACAKDPKLTDAAAKARVFALAANLLNPDAAAREATFKELVALKSAAFPGLRNILDHEIYQEAIPLAKSVYRRVLVGEMAQPAFDDKALKPFRQDEKKGIAGNPHIKTDPKSKLIAIDGEFSIERGPLEYMVVCKGENAKTHETVLALDCEPMDVCYALLQCEYTYAGELRDGGKVNLPKGAGVMFSIEYEINLDDPMGKEKKVVVMPMQALAWNTQTQKPMRIAPFAFTGSIVKKDNEGRAVLMAQIERSVVAVMSDPVAILNMTLDTAELANVAEGSQAYYEINQFLAPAAQTKCRLIFQPWVGELKAADLDDRGEHDEKAAHKPHKQGEE